MSENVTGAGRTSQVDVVAQAMRQKIAEYKFTPGESITQTSLSKLLGTSRTPVREALKQLEAEGFLTQMSNGRYQIVPFTAETYQENLEIRMRLEPWMLELSIPLFSEKYLDGAELFLDKLDHCDDDQWAQRNWEFHTYLMTPANRPKMLNLIEQLYRDAQMRMGGLNQLVRDRSRSQDEHRRLLNLCREAKSEQACQLLEDHLLVHGSRQTDRLRALLAHQDRVGS